MAKRAMNNVKLGAFVLAGLFCLILLLYMIGKNRNMFGSNFILKSRFENVQGLKQGNNVRYAGIDVGTVKKVTIINDTLMEVIMIIDNKMKTVIHKNALVSIATDGLVGNKVVNISAVKQLAPLAQNGDILASKRPLDTDEMLKKLNNTNNDIGSVAEELKYTIQRINNSNALWSVLNEKGLPQNLKLSAINIRQATARAKDMANDLYAIVNDVKMGKGSIGSILTDTSFAYNLNEAVVKIKSVGDEADSLSRQISDAVSGIQRDVDSGKGTIHSLLKDSLLVIKLNKSLDNIQQGTDGFNQNMEALKHNFLFRGYFRRLEKQKIGIKKDQ
ncbi:MCE family protein [Ginsengibacter hankyongi]|uniref:MCE family protein n=1 Tax=Ginsengibacter hankyongi TaxID=2607284 RepID=A0A5J5IFQ1_9BACT|nr:MlaD family protein [Ginsengibacter hankyongi]KAA9038454.1 MCE family protein [Ginsengibacter hankyongi]